MPNRARDWLDQAGWDLELARHAASGAFHEWACFAAQQVAEKALKADATQAISDAERIIGPQ